MLVSLNNQILAAEDAKIPALSSAALYGSGVFTTAAIYEKRIFQWERHWQRLMENAEKVNVRLPADLTEESIRNSVSELVERSDLTEGRARITIFDEVSSGVWSFEASRRASILIVADKFRGGAPEELRLTLSPHRINSKSPLAGVKSCNYLENLVSREEAKSRRCDEAIRLNENGAIASACMANIFWVNDGALFTPALETGCLAGTTRALIIEMAKKSGIDVYTIAEQFEELRLADEIFLTSAGIGIAKVRNLDGETYGEQLTNRLQKEFFARIRD